MCGRYTIYSTLEEIIEEFEAETDIQDLKQFYNAAPSQQLPVIINDNGTKNLQKFSWGLLPSWAKERSMSMKTINARAETVAEKPSFRSAFRKRRCLIPVNGFYEWQKTNSGKKAVYFTPSNSKFFAFAGLWEKWCNSEQEIYSFTVITTSANTKVSDIHHRMPVILTDDERKKLWLSNNSEHDGHLESCLHILQPCADEEIEYHYVSNKVNAVRNNTADLIRPFVYEDQETFF